MYRVFYTKAELNLDDAVNQGQINVFKDCKKRDTAFNLMRKRDEMTTSQLHGLKYYVMDLTSLEVYS